MEATLRFSYTDVIIPPRCRKARGVRFDDGVMTVTIPEVTAEEAPVAIVADLPENKFGVSRLEYRFYAGNLWVPIRMCGDEPTGYSVGDTNCQNLPFPAELDITTNWGQGGNYAHNLNYGSWQLKSDVEADLRKQMAANLMIDGVLYRVAGEPRYVVMTFGLGANHGGTAVMTSFFYNSNIGKNRYFSLLEKDKALALATQIATGRGDDKSLPMEINGPRYEVLIPEAIKVSPNEQHGDGCDFLNALEAMTQVAPGSPVTALAALASLAAN